MRGLRGGEPMRRRDAKPRGAARRRQMPTDGEASALVALDRMQDLTPAVEPVCLNRRATGRQKPERKPARCAAYAEANRCDAATRSLAAPHGDAKRRPTEKRAG